MKLNLTRSEVELIHIEMTASTSNGAADPCFESIRIKALNALRGEPDALEAPQGMANGQVVASKLDYAARSLRSIADRGREGLGESYPEIVALWAIIRDLAASPARAPLTDEQRKVLSFLYGVGDLDGCGFGEKPDGERGNFWWRKHLRAAFPECSQDGIAAAQASTATAEKASKE